MKFIEDLEFVLGVRNFNHFFFFFFFFFDGWLGRGCLVVSRVRGEWLHLLHTFWSRAWVEKTKHNYVDQVYAGIFCFDHVLRHLEARGQGVVIEDGMSRPLLPIFVDEYVGLDYFREVWFIH